jgi:hypothetical protein
MSFRSGLGASADRIIGAVAAEAVASPRYVDRSYFDASAERLIVRGGFLNDTSGRAAYGVSKADVDAARRSLRRAGFRLSWDAVDGFLAECYCALSDPVGYAAAYATPAERERRRPGWRSRKARARAKARAEGRCIVCGSPADQPERLPAAGRATCGPCGAEARDRQARAKARKTATPSVAEEYVDVDLL